MTLRFGPADVVALAFPTSRVPDAVREATLAALRSGVVTLLDLVVIRRSEADELEILELEDLEEDLGLAEFTVSRQGLTGQEDIDTFGAALAPGTTALVLVVEHTWARDIVATAADAGAIVLAAERVPAAVVEAVVELAEAG